jgi:hypothetical protein
MRADCPHPPAAPTHLGVELRQVPVGTRLVRFHSPSYAALSFNPNVDSTGTPRRMDVKEDGSRFNPFKNATGINVSTLYAGTTEHAAALESVFHDVPHVPDPQFPTSKLHHFVLSHFVVQRALHVLELINSQLRQVPVPGRDDQSLLESELVHSNPQQYPMTRRWAQYFFNSLPALQGLAWRPRLGGEGTAYIFFGDRISAPTDLAPEGSPIPVASGAGFTLIEKIATDAHIALVHTRR